MLRSQHLHTPATSYTRRNVRPSFQRTFRFTDHVLPSPRCSSTSAPAHNTQPFDILFFGRDEFSCTVLSQLHAGPDVWEHISIVTNPDSKTGRRGSIVSVSPLKLLAESLSLPVHTIPHSKPAFRTWQLPPPFSKYHTLPSSDASSSSTPPTSPARHHLLITASFGRILPAPLLRAFAPGRALNVHPSLLPLYRGASPIQYTIMNGDTRGGVSIIDMMERKKGIDAGGIWAQEEMDVRPESTFPTLRDDLAERGGKLLVDVLRHMLAGTAKSTPQDPVTSASSPRAPSITAQDALVDFSLMSCDQIIRLDRGISHQKPLTVYTPSGLSLQLSGLCRHDSDRGILEISPLPGVAAYDPHSRSVLVRCADGAVLGIDMLQEQNRRAVPAKVWWNGVRGRETDFVDGSVRLSPAPTSRRDCSISYGQAKD
ncbi:Formyltransferase [Coniophora puteana RWD-64-598 SS2]|uniref:methionyl-tRNA formyltransferase n=1 Tax=Coniophora puteana (strain RWD-64-598) TaxID=741705 RepID=A0A5M3MH95_CONPW|nr:Formyltransferase [Coniophora puteana RWD-64-598 SS2]EIW78599.1 Formyltransferase [Coniophora puteana RWD-64-598 SS2]